MKDPVPVRKRMVCLKRIASRSQAQDACAALRKIQGVVDAQPISNHRLTLTYSLEFLSFELVEGLLKELGFFLDNSILARIRRTIYQYLEDNVREKLHIDDEKQTLVIDVEADLPHKEPEKYWNNYR
jgi:hypothetical protein